jgi:hypothetical protein
MDAMNKRLVWNFEIDSHKPLEIQKLLPNQEELIRWEARYFWPENKNIVLYGLDEALLDLSMWKIKQKYDVYFLLPNLPYNIKQRKQDLLYKPLLAIKEPYRGFGSKINLTEEQQDSWLAGTDSWSNKKMLVEVQNNSKSLEVEKTVCIYKFSTEPKIKLEIARLKIHNQYYLSLCIEGHSFNLVQEINEHLLQKQITCDYVHFLRGIT